MSAGGWTSCHMYDVSTMSASLLPISTRRRRSSSGSVSRSRARGCSWRASSSTRSSASPTPAPRSSCCGRPTEVPGWSSRALSGPTTSPDRPRRWPTSWGCATWPSRSTTSSGRRPAGRGRLRAGRRHRPVRAHLAHGLRARSGGDHRVPGRADRLTAVRQTSGAAHRAAASTRCARPWARRMGMSRGGCRVGFLPPLDMSSARAEAWTCTRCARPWARRMGMSRGGCRVGSCHHWTCPPLGPRRGHVPVVPGPGREEWACPAGREGMSSGGRGRRLFGPRRRA